MTYSSERYKNHNSVWRRVRRWDIWPVLGGVSLMLGGIALFLFLIFAGGTLIDRHVSQGECDSWAHTSGYTVQWRDSSFWTYGCVAKTQTGKWLPIDQLREVDR